MPVVEVHDLERSYSIRKGIFKVERTVLRAVRGVSFSIEEGQVFGLLGPNGAGKTSTVKMLTTLLLPTGGRAEILGIDVAREPKAIRKQVGYVFGGDRGLYDRLSAYDNLRYFSELYGLPWRTQSVRIGELLEMVGLAGREQERVEGFSRGMRQRLHIARGLLHDPRVVFLDEPTIGLDPVGSRELRSLVKDLRQAGKTLLLTTHYMFEADELCDQVAIINGGEIIASGTPEELKKQARAQSVVEIETFGVPAETLDAVERLSTVRGMTAEQRGHTQLLSIQTDAGTDEVVDEILAILDETEVGRVSSRQPTLEDAYVELISSR